MTVYDARFFVDRKDETARVLQLLNTGSPACGVLIGGAASMGKTWLLRSLSAQLTPGPAAWPDALLDFRHPRERQQMQDGLGLIRLIRKKLDLPQYFDSLNRTINRYTGRGPGAPIAALQRLADKMAPAYDLNELKTLARRLDVDPDDLARDVKPTFTFELIRYLYQRGRLDELIAELKGERPHGQADWQASLDEIAGRQEGGTRVEDGGGPLLALGVSDREVRQAEDEISEVFFTCVRRLLADRRPLVLCIDHYHQQDDAETPPEARSWICNQLLTRLTEPGLQKLVVIICGRRLPAPEDLGLADQLSTIRLRPLSPEDIREYWLNRRQAPVPPSMDAIKFPEDLAKLSGGVPGALALMAKNYLDEERGLDPFLDGS